MSDKREHLAHRGSNGHPTSTVTPNGTVEASRDQHVVDSAEERVIGALFYDSTWAVPQLRDGLGAEDFDNPLLGSIYREAIALHDETGSVDTLDLTRNLGSSLDAAGGPEYLDELARGVASARNAPSHAKIIREAAVGRCQVETLREAEKQIQAGGGCIQTCSLV